MESMGYKGAAEALQAIKADKSIDLSKDDKEALDIAIKLCLEASEGG